ncbi:unnamed protein product [Candidula unifasciata]|uniref:Uncharacterized protein n=1 Tax=Candidula unifasciata TaxID=100452 RepID=A0A8S3ZIF7_9EUPU|nr:unnamed protein product [Candidula unifasciata]
MALQVNVGVFDPQNKVSYAVTSKELEGLKDKNFSFTIEETADGMSQAVFRITDDSGKILRENISKPFPAGAIQKKSTELQRHAFVVKVKKQPGVNLNDYF